VAGGGWVTGALLLRRLLRRRRGSCSFVACSFVACSFSCCSSCWCSSVGTAAPPDVLQRAALVVRKGLVDRVQHVPALGHLGPGGGARATFTPSAPARPHTLLARPPLSSLLARCSRRLPSSALDRVSWRLGSARGSPPTAPPPAPPPPPSPHLSEHGVLAIQRVQLLSGGDVELRGVEALAGRGHAHLRTGKGRRTGMGGRQQGGRRMESEPAGERALLEPWLCWRAGGGARWFKGPVVPRRLCQPERLTECGWLTTPRCLCLRLGRSSSSKKRAWSPNIFLRKVAAAASSYWVVRSADCRDRAGTAAAAAGAGEEAAPMAHRLP
jgi:hypothetical protein